LQSKITYFNLCAWRSELFTTHLGCIGEQQTEFATSPGCMGEQQTKFATSLGCIGEQQTKFATSHFSGIGCEEGRAHLSLVIVV